MDFFPGDTFKKCPVAWPLKNSDKEKSSCMVCVTRHSTGLPSGGCRTNPDPISISILSPSNHPGFFVTVSPFSFTIDSVLGMHNNTVDFDTCAAAYSEKSSAAISQRPFTSTP